MYVQLRRLLRDLAYYLKKHPMKVFMLVIMPLITGGALSGLLSACGIRLPVGVEQMFGMPAHGYGGYSGASIGRGRGGVQFERERYEGPVGGGVGGLMNVAKMFM